MIYIFSGKDDFSLNRALEEVKEGIGDQSLLAANTTVLEGQHVTSDQLSNVIEAAPFLAERRLVIVKGLLERIQPKTRSSRRKKTAPANQGQDEYKLIFQSIERVPPSTTLVFVDRIDLDGRTQNKSPIIKELISRADVVKYFPLLRGSLLKKWIRDEVNREGGRISGQAVDLLVNTVGSNLWIMQNEIKKLTLYTSGRCIEEDDVKEVVGYAQEASVFAMVDAVIGFKLGVAERLVGELMEKGAAPVQLLYMITRQFRMIARIKGLKEKGIKDQEIQNKLGLTSEFAFRKTLEQSSRYPMVRIRDVYRRLLAADIFIKTGKYSGETALNILVAELCE